MEGIRLRKAALLALVSFSVSLLVFLSGALEGFELRAYDLLSRQLNPLEPETDIVIVKVDQESIDALSEEGIMWPWPRQMYAPIIEYLSDADAVFIDILFTEPSSYGVQDDLIMAGALKEASNVFLPVFLTGRQRALTEKDRAFLRKISLDGAVSVPVEFKSAVMPIDELKAAARGGGNVTVAPDGDGVYRRAPLVFGMDGQNIPGLVFSYLTGEGRITVCGKALCLDGQEIPLRDGKMLLRYYQKPFPSVSAGEVLDAYSGDGANLSQEFFRGKKVLIGLTAAGLYDLKPTSMSSISTGVDIHAAMLANLMDKDFIKPLGDAWNGAFMFAACFIISFVVLSYYSAYVNLPVFVVLSAACVVVPAVLFRYGYYMNTVAPLAALTTGFIIAAAYSYAIEGRERRFTRRAFSQYMDTRLVDYLLENPRLIRPGGQRTRVTVFFADLADFTAVAEKVPAEDAARVLHGVLNSFTDAIIEHCGVVDKYIGDAVMAFWGAPIASKADDANACACALECIDALKDVNRSFAEEGLPEISARIGIHSGDAIAGNLGSDRLFDYTVVGDTVNLASRIESANKLFGTGIIVSEETLRKTDGQFLARELGTVEVKGKTMPVKIFELVSKSREGAGRKKEIVLSFSEALSLYYERNWDEALDVLKRILEGAPDDGPSKFYRDRCERLLKNPEDGWEVIKITEK